MNRSLSQPLMGALLALSLGGSALAAPPQGEPMTPVRAARALTRDRYIVATGNKSHIAIRAKDAHGRVSIQLLETPVRNADGDHALAVLFDSKQAHLAAAKLIERGQHVSVQKAEPDDFGVPRFAWDLSRLRHQPLHTGFVAAVREYENEKEEVEAAPPSH